MTRGVPLSQFSNSPKCCPRIAPIVFSIASLAILWLAAVLPMCVRANEAPRAGATIAPIEYRRIFVPADKMEAWPRNGEKLIPIESRDFDEWIRSANDAAGQTNQVVISKAEYTARLESNGRLHGDGRWTLSTHGAQPAFLPLGNLALDLRNPQWHDVPQQPVRIGMWGQTNRPASRFGLEVVRSGTLKFEWHARTSSADDQLEIPWHVPVANSARLTLDLPEGKQPRIEGSVVLESALLPSDNKSPGKPHRRWVIGLSPVQVAALRILNADRRSSQSDSQMAFHEEVGYRIGPRGLEMTTTWRLEGYADVKRELAVAVPTGLQLASIKSEGNDVAWRLIREASSPTDTALIDLPKVDGSKPRQLTFSAWRPVVVDAPWRLPRLRPEGFFWSSGKFELAVAASHELKRLNPDECIETDTSRLIADEDLPETHSFMSYSPSAAIEVDISARRTDATIRAGSSLTLADPNLNGRLVVEWSFAHGAAHRLTGKLAPGWIVEALETIPADALADWYIDRRSNEQEIEIQLSRAATAARNVTVIVTARLQRFNLTEPISADVMKMVKWDDAKPTRHLLTFESNEPYAVVPIGKLPEVVSDTFDTSDRQLLDETTENKIFDITDAGQNAGVQLTVRRGQFAAHIEVETIYENEVLRQDYRVSAEPKSGPIDRMLVYSTIPLGDNTRWIDQPSNAPIAAAKLHQNDPQRASLPTAGEVWLLRLPQPTSRPVQVAASIAGKRLENAPVPIFFLPEAVQQDARILVRCRNQNGLWVEPNRLQTIPLPSNDSTPNGSNNAPPVIAAYRYLPADCRDPALAPKLSVCAVPESKTIPLIARHIALESFVWPDGTGAHSATFELDNHGATELSLLIPSGARLMSASLDGQSLEVPKPSETDQPTRILLPAQTRSTRLSLYLETSGPSLAAGRELTPPSILSGIPFVAGDWTVWLPEEYSAARTGLSHAAPKFNWRERLFGVLGRPAGSRPFNPFRLADGAALVNDLADGSVAGSPANSPNARPQIGNHNADVRTPPNSTDFVAMPPAGWRRFHESFVASGPKPITVIHRPAITAWAVAMLLASFLSGRFIKRRHAEALVIVLAAAAASALLLPFAYANLASGAVLGLLLSLFSESPQNSIAANEGTELPGIRSAVTVALAIVAAVCVTKLTYAQTPQSAAAPREATNKVYRAMIPIDAQGRPVGTKYYVSDEFLRALTAAASESSGTHRQWLLNDATYKGELTERAQKKEVGAGNWTFTFSIETLARDTTVVLPLHRSEAEWNPTAMLDGIPLPIKWNEAGRACVIEIPEPGRYLLSLMCVPKTATVEGRNQLDLSIPPILGANVEIQYPGTVTDISVPKTSVLSGPTSQNSTLSAELDRTNRLQVQWSRTEKSENGTTGFSITELRWLRVTPDDLETTVKYVLEGGARRPDSITVTYDDRWKLLTSEKSINAKLTTGIASQHVIRIPVPTQTTDRQELSLRWRLVNKPALGNLRLPPIDLASNQPTMRWMAISSDPTLDCEIPDASATDATVNEFLTKWGDTDSSDPPEWVLSNFDPHRAASLAIRPRETEPTVEEQLNVSVGLTSLRANYEATLTPGLAGANRVELAVPADLTISGITVTDDDRLVPLRWSQSAKNRVNIFFGEQLKKPYRLVLDGTTPVDANGKATLPQISTLATEDATQKIRLYRDDDVHVDLEGLPAKKDSKAEQPGPPPSEWTVRPVAICYLESGSTTARLSVSPNKFNIAGDSLTTLTRENGAWWVNYRCQLIVEDGDLDILRLRLPNDCVGPFDVQCVLPVTTEFNSADDQFGVFSVRFATTIAKGGSADLRIRSPLKSVTATQVSVPAISIEALTSGHRYVAVPESADSQAIRWTETGVRPAIVPQKLRPTSAAPTTTHYLEIVSNPFQVATRPPAAPEVAPQIRLADTAVIASDLGTQRITTRLILAPHGLTDCTLQLPPGQTLVSAELDGRPAIVRQLDPLRWQVGLGAPQLPQSLQIVSRSSATRINDRANGNVTDLQRPALLAHGEPIPAEMSLWSFAHPQSSVSRLVAGADELNAVEQAALRFDRLVSIAEAAKATAAELPPPDGYNWYQPWAKLLTTVRTETYHTNTAPRRERVESQVSHTAEDQIAQAAARLDKWLDDCRKTLLGPVAENAEAIPASIDSPNATRSIAPSADKWSYYVAEGGNDRLELHLRSLGPTPAQNRLLGLLAIAASLVGAISLMRRPAAIDFFYRWPHACGVLLGITYWAWMWPSWLGILIAAASLWLALRFAWPGRSMRTEASTVLRASRMT